MNKVIQQLHCFAVMGGRENRRGTLGTLDYNQSRGSQSAASMRSVPLGDLRSSSEGPVASNFFMARSLSEAHSVKHLLVLTSIEQRSRHSPSAYTEHEPRDAKGAAPQCLNLGMLPTNQVGNGISSFPTTLGLGFTIDGTRNTKLKHGAIARLMEIQFPLRQYSIFRWLDLSWLTHVLR